MRTRRAARRVGLPVRSSRSYDGSIETSLTTPSTLTARLDPESAGWLRTLRAGGATEQSALAQLHRLLLAAARRELGFRTTSVPFTGVERDDLAHQAAADALVAILAKLDDYAGRSRFTTWAYKFVILEVSRKAARHMWRGHRVLLPFEDWTEIPARFGFSPEERVESRELIEAVGRAIEQDLTDHQRAVLGAVVLRGVPVDEVVVELGSSRNAIYKTLFDARRRLRKALAAGGHVLGEAES
jgi:RNA polymerase sigma-70 factor (ECF subfamily)